MRAKAVAAIAAGALALGLLAQSARAHVATIDGSYDTLFYDTPALTFHNTSGFAFTNVHLHLFGYQAGTLSFGLTGDRDLPDIAAGTDANFIWLDPTSAGNLFSYDYDDSFGGGGPCPVNPVNSSLCNNVGNFAVVFTAMWNGVSVFSVFSPTTNATGGFVGWEGLDPNGLSEDPIYDVHNGTLNGTLAYIDIGTPPLPEPGTLALLAIALAGFGLARKRRG